MSRLNAIIKNISLYFKHKTVIRHDSPLYKFSEDMLFDKKKYKEKISEFRNSSEPFDQKVRILWEEKLNLNTMKSGAKGGVYSSIFLNNNSFLKNENLYNQLHQFISVEILLSQKEGQGFLVLSHDNAKDIILSDGDECLFVWETYYLEMKVKDSKPMILSIDVLAKLMDQGLVSRLNPVSHSYFISKETVSRIKLKNEMNRAFDNS